MKQFERDVLHWINYDYVVINNDLTECYSKITNLINAVLNDGSKDYDSDYIRSHVDKLTLNFHIPMLNNNKYSCLKFGALNLNQF